MVPDDGRTSRRERLLPRGAIGPGWTWRLLAGNRCHRIRRADAATFRSVAGYLSEQIAHAVREADGKYNGVRFHWVDTSQVYENDATGRHGLCTGSPWLNGLTLGTGGSHSGSLPGRVFRSFHPKQEGHDALGVAVADVARGLDWSSLRRGSETTSIADAVLGSWGGTIMPSDDRYSEFEVTLLVEAGRVSLRIPAGDCVGLLLPFALTSETVELSADSLSGECNRGGTWRLSLVGEGDLRYEWLAPSSSRVDEGVLTRARPDPSNQWPLSAGSGQGPSILCIHLGAEFTFPDWVSCTDDDLVCIVGSGDEVRVYATNGVRYVTSIDVDADEPAAELRAIGATDSQVDELLSPN